MDNETLAKTVKEMLAQMDFSVETEVAEEAGDFVMVKISSDEAGLLIGQGGENLAALQHLARLIVGKKMGSETPNFIVDVNDYRANRISILKDMVLASARQVEQDKHPYRLEPMNAYERRIVHMMLKGYPGILTESEGDGEDRRIVIKPSSDVS